MRLFIGIELPGETRALLAERAQVVRASIRTAAAIKWVEPVNLHVTVAFLGQVAPETADALRAALAAPVGPAAFEARLSALGAFPPSGPVRVLWAGFDRGREGLIRLHDQLYARLGPLGFEPDRRPYSPHVTLGRVKSIDGRGTRAVWQALAAGPALAAPFTVSEATLYRSQTLPTGPQYEPLLRVPLA